MNDDSERKTITVDAAAFERCSALKDDGESWSAFFGRVAETLETAGREAEHTLTERHIDDIAARTARQTADELETRFS